MHQNWTLSPKSNISQKFAQFAPDLDFTNTRSDVSQKFAQSAPDLDFA